LRVIKADLLYRPLGVYMFFSRSRDPSVIRAGVCACTIAVVSALLAFTSVADAAVRPVDLGSADSYSVVAGTMVINNGPSVITGSLATTGSQLIGFPPGIVVGGVVDDKNAAANQAVIDVSAAWADAGGRTGGEAVGYDITGFTLDSGLYTSPTGMGLNGDVTLDAEGNPDAVFILRMTDGFNISSNSRVLLTNGAQACNVFWRVGAHVSMSSDTHFAGDLLVGGTISAGSRADVQGRLLARGNVNIDTVKVNPGTCVVAEPVVTLDDHPSGPVNHAGTASFTGSDTYTCEIDGHVSACASPLNLEPLGDGEHTVKITGYNTRLDASDPAEFSYTLDRAAPNVTLVTQGGPFIAPATATVAVTSDDPTATIACQIKGGAPVVPCSPSAQIELPVAGTYTLTATATDKAGNVKTASVDVVAGVKGKDPDTDPVIVKPSDATLPGVTDPSKPATCPAVNSLAGVSAQWVSPKQTIASPTLATNTATPGVWRCLLTGTENGKPVTYRSLPVLISGGKRAMLTAETAKVRKLAAVKLLSSGSQKMSVRVYQRSNGAWKLGRKARFDVTVKRGTNTMNLAKRLKTSGKGNFKFVVRAYTTKAKVSDALVQEIAVG
jgi:hypothetical protein